MTARKRLDIAESKIQEITHELIEVKIILTNIQTSIKNQKDKEIPKVQLRSTEGIPIGNGTRN